MRSDGDDWMNEGETSEASSDDSPFAEPEVEELDRELSLWGTAKEDD